MASPFGIMSFLVPSKFQNKIEPSTLEEAIIKPLNEISNKVEIIYFTGQKKSNYCVFCKNTLNLFVAGCFCYWACEKTLIK
jgi:hypothetical protein